MEVEASHSKILQYSTIQPTIEETQEDYFLKHWIEIESIITTNLITNNTPKNIVKLSRSLKILLNRGQYVLVYQNLVRLFYKIYKDLLINICQSEDCLLGLLDYYSYKKHDYKIIFDILNNLMGSHSRKQKQTMEEKAYNILCKEIINSQLSDKINKELMNLIHHYRTQIDQSKLLQIQQQLKLTKLLGIFESCESDFLERSKSFYINLSTQIIKNENIFVIIDSALQKQIRLNKILCPAESTINYLQKQLIEEYFPFMIEFVDYLIHQGKYNLLKILWNYTIKLGAQALEMLENRLEDIIRDCSKYLKQKSPNLGNILTFICQISKIINQCFDGNKNLINLLNNTIEQLLIEEEKVYNEMLSKQILSGCDSQDVIFRLFKLVPNKQNFIREFEVRFFRWILNHEIKQLSFQEQIVQSIKRQCGGSLCKKMERMIGDVWKDNKMIYHYNQSRTFKCRMLSNDWPKFTYENFNLPDQLTLIIHDFETSFRTSPENKCKEIKWINQFGTITLTINGIESEFSESQASIILVMDRFARPMKKEQLSQILQLKLQETEAMVDQLAKSNILNYNEKNKTFEINDNNLQSYQKLKSAKQDFEEIKILSKRDDSIIIQAWIVKILKKKKAMQKTDLTTVVIDCIPTFKPTFEQINQSLQKLIVREFIEVDKMKGTIRYRQ